MATIYDVAKEAEVSIAAVSLVISDPATTHVGKVKRKKILEIAARLGYSPSRLAKALSSGSTRILGLVVPMRDPIFFNLFIAQVLAGIQQSCIERGYHLMIYSHNAASGRITQAELLQSQYVDGVIVLNTRMCSDADIKDTIRDLKNAKVPFVMSNCYANARGINYVGVDDQAIGTLAARYLAGKGHRRIAMISGASPSPMTHQLLKGFTQGLKTASVPFHESLHVHSEYDEAIIRKAIAKWFAKGSAPTAIFCADDQLVPDVYRALHALGKSVPGDVAVLGRGNLNMATAVQPPLSTIAVPAFEMGKAATLILIDAMNNSSHSPTKLILEGSLIERESI